MRRSLVGIVACVLLLQAVYIGPVYSQGDACDWTLEPKTDGSVHVKVLFTLGYGYATLPFTAPAFQPIQNMKAWEAATGKSLNVKETDKGTRTEYEVEIPGRQGGGYQVYVEYDQLLTVFKMPDQAYHYYFGWRSWMRTVHTATVILPKNHELLFTEESDPVDVTTTMGKSSVIFEQDTPEDEVFGFEVAFSDEGVNLLKAAENSFRMKKYAEAQEKYEEAIEFYSEFETLYGKNKNTFINDLKRKVAECETGAQEDLAEQEKADAENKYAEAMAAFNNKEYSNAEKLFKEAQTMYTSLGDSEKADECQEYIDKSTTFAEQEQTRSEAEALFSEGESYFGQQLYEDAKAKFEEALAKYTELGDEEKINECNERISSCEQALTGEGEEDVEEGDGGEDGGSCVGTSLIVMILLGAALVSMMRYRNRK